ncbi:MAG: DUF3105 domain-containing protein, partial [Chloroflexota bacterium]
SLLLQVARLESAAAGAAPVPLVVSLVQITIIGFEIAATVYLALRLAASGVRWLGRAAGGTPVARVRGLVVAGVAVAALVALWSPVVLRAADQNIAGMAIVGVNQRDHVDGPISYDRSPPAGGNHAPVWQNCGFYAAAVPSERAVHSLEHGAVWITYGPGLPGADVDKLRGLAGQSYVLVTPFAQNPSPVVATAWGRQLLLQNANDPRLDQFVRAFRAGPQAPERGQPCSGGSSATQ